MKPELDKVNEAAGKDIVIAERATTPVDLNNKKLLEFLVKYPDYESLDMKENSTELKQRSDAFVMSNELTQKLTKVYKDTFQAESGIKLEKKDFDAVQSYIERQAIEKPQDFPDLNKKIEEFNQYPALIQKLQHELDEIGGYDTAKAEAKGQKETLQKSLTDPWYKKIFVRSINVTEQGKIVNVKRKNVKEEIVSAKDKLADLDTAKAKLEEMTEKLDKAKTGILSELDPAQEIIKNIQAKIKQKYEELLDPANVKKNSLDKMQKEQTAYFNLRDTTRC